MTFHVNLHQTREIPARRRDSLGKNLGNEIVVLKKEEDKAISIPVGDYGGWKSDVKRIQSVSQSNLEVVIDL
eukprot:335655-Amorphochlora_amoeboformis.AAC.1